MPPNASGAIWYPSGVDVTLLMPGFVQTRPRRDGRRRKPFRMDLETATARMERAIIARRRRLVFPWPLALAVGTSRLLPFGLDERLLAGRGRSPTGVARKRPNRD